MCSVDVLPPGTELTLKPLRLTLSVINDSCKISRITGHIRSLRPCQKSSWTWQGGCPPQRPLPWSGRTTDVAQGGLTMREARLVHSWTGWPTTASVADTRTDTLAGALQDYFRGCSSSSHSSRATGQVPIEPIVIFSVHLRHNRACSRQQRHRLMDWKRHSPTRRCKILTEHATMLSSMGEWALLATYTQEPELARRQRWSRA